MMNSTVMLFQAGPHFFMDEDVVLVTIQYRLGPLGFLSLQNEDIKVRS
jgi:carboxylesterase type B